jgi:hypothetical protein
LGCRKWQQCDLALINTGQLGYCHDEAICR